MYLNREPQADDPNSKFMGSWDTYHAFNWDKVEQIRRRGAAGILMIQDRTPRAVKQTPASSPRPAGGPDYALAGKMYDIPAFTINREIADQLLAPSGKPGDTLQESTRRSVPNRSKWRTLPPACPSSSTIFRSTRDATCLRSSKAPIQSSRTRQSS